MTRVKIDAVEDKGNTTDGAVFVRYSTHPDGGVYTASTAFGGGGGSLSLSAGTSSAALGSVEFANSNGVSFGLNGATVTAQHNGLTSQSNQALSAANGSFAFQTATFANSNGISFSTGTQGIYASHNGLTSQSNQQVSLYAVGNTTQSTSGTQGAASLSFRGEGVASVGVSNGSVVVSVPSGGGGSPVAFSAGYGGSSTFQTLSFADGNGVSWSNDGGSIKPIVTQSNQAASASNGSFAFQTIAFSNANNVTFGTSAGSIITASVAAAASSPMTVYAGGSSDTEHKLSFVNANGVSFGLGGANNSQITASHNGLTSQSNQAASASNGSFAFQTLGFSNANNVTFGTSAGSIITASVAAPGGGAGITASHWPFVPWPIATSTLPLGTTGGTGGSTQITASFHVCPLVIPAAIAYGAVLMPVSFATVAGTGSVTMGHQIGLYTLNGATLSQVTSWAWGARLSQNSVTAQSWNWWYGSDSTANTSSLGGNVSATFASLADIVMMDKTTATLNAGQYFLAAIYTRRSSNAAVWGTVHRGQYSVSQFTAAPIFGSNTVRAMIHSLNGLASITTNVPGVTANMLPASFATSIITHTGGTSRNQWPVFKLTPVL